MYSTGYLSRCIAMRHGTSEQEHQRANYKYVIGKVENLAKYDVQYQYKAIIDVDV